MLPPLSARWYEGAVGEERRVSERDMDGQQHGEETILCTVCGTSTLAGDRFCAECGALLPQQASPEDGDTPAAPPPIQPELSASDASQGPRTSERETAAWIFGARPATVIGGGLL